jgi:hypothetical protein
MQETLDILSDDRHVRRARSAGTKDLPVRGNGLCWAGIAAPDHGRASAAAKGGLPMELITAIIKPESKR